ncbi:RNA polymerase sigma factor SigI [Priestia endophytica]|uniref:RNA polymerase sigma factor SigI n=1 Tax=Priestia endophytica TaxID=135735 RepID=UPI0022813EAF|nr:RNA polymerase sigma factor SigI [Priestia endophytica]MCY8230715.1 RNA polymerase sigma factor SigI [Priestia endophytica]
MRSMLSILFGVKRKHTVEELVMQAQSGDDIVQNELLEQYKPFIAKTVSSVCKRYIYETDDEFSIGLIAFHEAIEKYTGVKGSSFLSFCELVIKRRVIDYIRKEVRSRQLQDPSIDDSTQYDADLSINYYSQKLEQEMRKEEIIHYNEQLKLFSLSLEEIVNETPKHKQARKNAMEVAEWIVRHPDVLEALFLKKRLQIGKIEKGVHVSRKTIERNRKYIIAMTIVLAGEYVYLKDYIKGVLTS